MLRWILRVYAENVSRETFGERGLEEAKNIGFIEYFWIIINIKERQNNAD